MSTIKANYLLDAAGTGAPSFTNGMKADVFRDLSDVERARFASGYFRLAGGGIQFNGDTAAANALNDYETGTWTPTIFGTTTAGVGTYSTQSAAYVKIGTLVFFTGIVAITAHTGTGGMRVGGLPFVAATLGTVTVGYSNLTVPASSIVGGSVVGGANSIQLVSYTTAAAGQADLTIDPACTIFINGVYSA